MSYPFLATFLAFGLLMSLILMTAFLWIGAQLAKMNRVSLSHLIGTVMAIGVFNVALVCLALWLRKLESPLIALFYLVLLMAVFFVIPWFWIRWRFRSRFAQAALACGVMIAGQIAFNVPLTLGSRLVVEAFVIPTGAMALTILGQHVNHECSDCGYPFPVSTSALLHPSAMAYRGE